MAEITILQHAHTNRHKRKQKKFPVTLVVGRQEKSWTDHHVVWKELHHLTTQRQNAEPLPQPSIQIWGAIKQLTKPTSELNSQDNRTA